MRGKPSVQMVTKAANLGTALTVVIATCICVCSDTVAAEPPMTGKPNIILILADDLGYGDLGVQGCKDIPTPNIDRIAHGGVRFTDAYANGSVCAPSRAALMSCQYQHRYGIEDLRGPLPAQAKTLPERLKKAGYATFMVGKWHLGSKEGFTPMDRGFDAFFGFHGGGHNYFINPKAKGHYDGPIYRNRQAVNESRYLTDAFGEEAAAFIEQRRGAAQPFFLYLAFNAVHTPLQATEKYKSRFPGIKNPKRQIYGAMLSAMDDAIGRALAKLEEVGQSKNTLIFFFNDNGGPTTRNAPNASRNTPLRGSKGETFEGGIRVPMLMQWPGVLSPGTTYSQPVAGFDISATALAVAGADTRHCDGVDLLPFLSGKNKGSPHETLFWRSRTMGNNYAVRQGDWKVLHSTEGSDVPGPKQTPAREMLFNLASDISEANDLAASEPAKLAELKKLYEAWSAEVDADCRKMGLTPRTDVFKSGMGHE